LFGVWLLILVVVGFSSLCQAYRLEEISWKDLSRVEIKHQSVNQSISKRRYVGLVCDSIRLISVCRPQPYTVAAQA